MTLRAPYWRTDDGRATLYCGDAAEVLAGIPDNSISLIATDPPYFRVKAETWDRQWETGAEYIAWIGELCKQWQRILKPNGSLYCFAGPKMGAQIEIEIGRWLNVLNRITWRKQDGTVNEGGSWSRANKDILRRFFEQKEEIIFAEHPASSAEWQNRSDGLRADVFESIRAYLASERQRAGVSKEDINEALGFRRLGGMAGRHYFSRSQWCLPTEEHYRKMRECFNAHNRGSEYLRRDYEDLRRDYEDLRRPFTVTPDVPYTDVWDFPTVAAYHGKHPCEKPLAMMRHIISASSRPGDTVLDCFAGSGVTGEAAFQLGRSFIGVEKDDHWCRVARKRIATAQRDTGERAAVQGMML